MLLAIRTTVSVDDHKITVFPECHHLRSHIFEQNYYKGQNARVKPDTRRVTVENLAISV